MSRQRRFKAPINADAALNGSGAPRGLSASVHVSSGMPGMQMAEEMPCCPEKQPVKPDCAKGCPLALVCTTSIFVRAPDVHAWSFAISWVSHRYDPLPASQLTSVFIEPPARPTRA